MNNIFSIISLGCSKNQVDSETMIQTLVESGLIYNEDPEKADTIIVNTCGFILPAKEESIDTTLELKNKYPDKKIIMAGCLIQRYGNEITDSMNEIDGFLYSKEPSDIVKLIKGTNYSLSGDTIIRKKTLSFPRSVYIKIADGCNNNCTYCAIPLIKGKIISRTQENIITEIKTFLKNGFMEFNIIAQDIGSFGIDRGKYELLSLLEKITKIKGDFWIRLLYIHPDHFPMEVLDYCIKDERILPYFDIPFQHGSDNILHAMGRKSSSEENISLIKNIRRKLPKSIIRSSFLVGFPGEQEKEFLDLLDFQKKAKIDWAGVFVFSPEEGTKAYNFKNNINKSIAKKRKNILEKAQIKITENNLSKFVGDKMTVLIEEAVENEELFLGRSKINAPEVDGLIVLNANGLNPGDIVRTKITRQAGFDLEGILI